MGKRNYGIDLLRPILMGLVCVIHVLERGGAMSVFPQGTAGWYVFWFMDAFAFCAVDAYALISGYMASDKPVKYSKLIEMWFQVFFYSFVLTSVLSIFGLFGGFSIKTIIKLAFPVTYEAFWYFTAYFIAFFFTPFVNRFVSSVKSEYAAFLLIIIGLIFPFMETLGISLKSNGGYSAFWLLMMYIAGALAKKIKLFESRNPVVLISVFFLSLLTVWFSRLFLGTERFYLYCSPFVAIQGLMLVLLFYRIPIREGTKISAVISRISPLAFGIYLFQCSPVIWENLEMATVPFMSRKVFIAVLQVLLFVVIIFVSELAVEYVRALLFRLLHIRELSCCIEKKAGLLISKITCILK